MNRILVQVLGPYLYEEYSLVIWNSNLIGNYIFLFTKFGNPNLRAKISPSI